MLAIIALTIVSFAIALPLIPVIKSDRRLTWTGAIGMGIWLSVIALLLIAEVPSRLLYWFDQNHVALSDKYPVIAPIMRGDEYIIVRDIVANTVQGIFFVMIFAAAYFWGERQRKAGRFRG